MIAVDAGSDARTPWSIANRAWFVLTFCMGIAFVFVLPPFQTNDEDSHWRRLWTVAQANLYCRTIPEAATQLPEVVHYVGDHSAKHVFGARYVEKGLQFRGFNVPAIAISTACGYFPLGYVPGAVVARFIALHGTHARTGGMLRAYYAVRLTNWILFSAVILLLTTRLAWMRHFTLFVYSVPGVLQQVVAINLDWFLMTLAASIVLALFTPARARSVLVLFVAVTLMTMTKPVYEALVLISAPVALELSRGRRFRWWSWILIAALAVVPALCFRVWVHSIPPETQRGWGVPWINPEAQVAFLRQHPFHVFRLFWNQFLRTFEQHRLIEGGWTSILGGFGWSAFEMPIVGYLLALVACGAALLADVTSVTLPRQVAADAPRWLRRAAWALAVTGGCVVIAGVIVGMYIYFTTPKADTVLGVQGRYYHVPLWFLSSMCIYAVKLWRPRWVQPTLSLIGAVLGVAASAGANAFAVFAIYRFYWGA
jgi:uncharacterized membrane protein